VHVRVTGVVIEDGETLAGALVREMREETGLDVETGRLLYVCDHLPGDGTHALHLTFEACRVGGFAGAGSCMGDKTAIGL
jgi:ADP-ribose pyrophosphatase YjhB (NUDIX family)